MLRIRVPGQLMVAAGLAVGLTTIGATASNHRDLRIIKMTDQCDPATFNAAFGAGTCISKHVGVRLDVFLQVLGQAGRIGAWQFAPGEVRLQDGQEFQAVNEGGEVHTFTEVDEFGGGFIDELNQLTGNLVPAPECNPATLEFIPPGSATEPEDEEPGVHHYQCCIHPWMRTDVVVR